MAELLTVARPYAEAAFKIAVDQNGLLSWSEALSNLTAVIRRPEAQALIGDPSLTTKQIATVISESAGQLSADQRSFVEVLAGNERLSVLPEITQLYTRLRNEHEKVLEAQVSTAFPLTDAQVSDLRATLQSKYGREVQVSVVHDPALIGGVSIRIGDEVMDASVRGKLAQLAAALVTQ